MNNKKQTIKPKKNRSRIIFVAYNLIILVALLTLTVAVVSQQKVIESLGRSEFNSFVGDLTNVSYQPVSIDPPEQKAYVPQAAISFDYTNQFSDIRYRLTSTELEVSNNNAQIIFSDKQQLIAGLGAYEKSCVDPYILSISIETPENYVQVGTKTLADGRAIVYAASSRQECATYIEGETGRELLAKLMTAQSY